jgi:hypothetical protein
LPTIPHNAKAKKFFRHFYKLIKKSKTEILYLHKYLEPRLFLELAARPNIGIGGEGPWSGR